MQHLSPVNLQSSDEVLNTEETLLPRARKKYDHTWRPQMQGQIDPDGGVLPKEVKDFVYYEALRSDPPFFCMQVSRAAGKDGLRYWYYACVSCEGDNREERREGETRKPKRE